MHYLRDELVKLGHRVNLIFSEDVKRPFSRGVLNSLTFNLFLPFVIIRLVNKNGRYDIVNIHTLGGSIYVFIRKIFKRLLPPCVIISFGDDELRWRLERDEEHLGGRQLARETKLLLYYNLVIRQTRYAISHADHVITPVNSEKDFYIRSYGIDKNKISVIRTGVAKEFFQDRKHSSRINRLLYFGGWEWRKGIRYLIEGFELIAQSFKDVTLSLVGVGQNESDIFSSFPFHLQTRLRVLPYVQAEDVPQVYATHDIFVFPSLFEAVPLVIMEAMASGMPIVTTRTCGMQEIIEDGVSGFLVSPRDAQALARQTMALLNDPVLCEKLGTAAQIKAKNFTWDFIAKQSVQAYAKLLK